MNRMLKLVLCLCVAAAPAAAAGAKKNPDVERAVKSELLKKSFTTKIVVGSYVACPNSVRADAIKPVDTELYPDGSVRYFARANCYYPVPQGVIDLGVLFDAVRFYVNGPLASQVQPGTTVLVQSVDFREDRIELNLSASGNNSAVGSGKIKYMLGANYRSMSSDEILEAIARGIVIPAYEKLVGLKLEFEVLKARLADAEAKLKSGDGTTYARLLNAMTVKDTLEKLQKNRADYTATGKVDPLAGVYTEKLNAIVPEIEQLKQQHHTEDVAAIESQLRVQLDKITEIQAQVRKKAPATQEESKQMSVNLTTYWGLLDDRQKLMDRLQSENEAVSSDDTKVMSEGRAEVLSLQKSLEQGRQQIALTDVATQYGQLTKKRAKALDNYVNAFATPKERGALQELVAVLEQMVTNRDQAATLGDKAAPAQLIKCRAELDKYKKK